MQMDAVEENLQIDKVSRLDVVFQAQGQSLRRNIHFSVVTSLDLPSNSLFPFFDLPRFFLESEITRKLLRLLLAGIERDALTTIIVGRLRSQVLGSCDWRRLTGCVVVVGTWRGASRSFSISAGFSGLTHHHFLDISLLKHFIDEFMLPLTLLIGCRQFFPRISMLYLPFLAHTPSRMRMTFRATVVWGCQMRIEMNFS
jgi:hypothetical protein